jgi:hypothetical protein
LSEAIRAAESRAEKRARELARVDAKHEDWEEKINTPQFAAWAYTDGPNTTEAKQLAALKRTAPDQAAVLLGDMARRYPKWWTERGALMESDRPADAIKLLDAYALHGKAEAERAKNQQRLEAAVPVKGTASQRQPTVSEREAAEKAFASA